MKKVFTFLVAALLIASVFAQAPQGISHQAVIRNTQGELVIGQTIGIRVSILQGSAEGTAVFVETHQPVSNENGLITYVIGSGTNVSGSFAEIDWADGPYFLKTEADPEGNDNYSITGTTQFLSVPYALHAKTADNGITTEQANEIAANTLKVGYTDALVSANADVVANTAKVGITTEQTTKLAGIAEGAEVNVQADWNQTTTTADDYIKNKPTIPAATRYLGEEYLDGIIFYLYIGSNGEQHGLVVSKTESTGTWSGSTLVGANRTEDGAYNTNLMPAGSTAKTWVTGLGAGWYLPSIDELNLLWTNRFHVNKTARAIGSTLLSTTVHYWSSTEYGTLDAFGFYFCYGNTNAYGKPNTFSVRAVRAF